MVTRRGTHRHSLRRRIPAPGRIRLSSSGAHRRRKDLRLKWMTRELQLAIEMRRRRLGHHARCRVTIKEAGFSSRCAVKDAVSGCEVEIVGSGTPNTRTKVAEHRIIDLGLGPGSTVGVVKVSAAGARVDVLRVQPPQPTEGFAR